jgi:hypothetical protein
MPIWTTIYTRYRSIQIYNTIVHLLQKTAIHSKRGLNVPNILFTFKYSVYTPSSAIFPPGQCLCAFVPLTLKYSCVNGHLSQIRHTIASLPSSGGVESPPQRLRTSVSPPPRLFRMHSTILHFVFLLLSSSLAFECSHPQGIPPSSKLDPSQFINSTLYSPNKSRPKSE